MLFNRLGSGSRRAATWLAVSLLCLLQAACGGGSSGNGASSSAPGMVATTPVVTTPAPAPTPTPTPTLSNFQGLVVDAGPANGVNMLYTSVTVCTPGDSTACATIDHVLVDTGSTGLRLFSSVLPPSLKLSQQAAQSGAPLVECTQFADGYSWGPVKVADIRLGGETIHAIPMQVIADPNFTSVPSDCSATGPAENTVQAFGSNGVLGVGNFINDCGTNCANQATPAVYYACAGSTCTSTIVPVAQQVQHPVSLLAQDNNGVLIQLPAVSPPGAASLAGTLIFGIGTETNNSLGAAKVYTVSPADGTLSIAINGRSFAGSFIDTGSNGYFFPSTLPQCSSGFYCPTSPQVISAVLQGTNGNNAAVSFTITNADSLLRDDASLTALPTLGGTTFDGRTVDFGLPFFFGRSVYTAIEGKTTPGGTGPYVAF